MAANEDCGVLDGLEDGDRGTEGHLKMVIDPNTSQKKAETTDQQITDIEKFPITGKEITAVNENIIAKYKKIITTIKERIFATINDKIIKIFTEDTITADKIPITNKITSADRIITDIKEMLPDFKEVPTTVNEITITNEKINTANYEMIISVIKDKILRDINEKMLTAANEIMAHIQDVTFTDENSNANKIFATIDKESTAIEKELIATDDEIITVDNKITDVNKEIIAKTKFDKAKTKFDKAKTKFDKAKTKFDIATTKLDKAKTKFDEANNEITSIYKKIGILGLSMMGHGMVKNLLDSGHEVTIWNPQKDNFSEIESMGATWADTPSELVTKCDITFNCVSDPEMVKMLVFGDFGVLSGIKEGKGYVEMTTIDPVTSQNIESAISEKRARYLEAPIIGSKELAVKEQLVILGAGDRDLFNDCETCFSAISRVALYLSPDVGIGSKVNLVFIMLTGTTFAAIAEAIAFIQTYNLSSDQFLQILSMGPFSPPVLKGKVDALFSRDKHTIAPVFQHQYKDTSLAIEIGKAVDIRMGLAGRTIGYFEQFLESCAL